MRPLAHRPVSLAAGTTAAQRRTLTPSARRRGTRQPRAVLVAAALVALTAVARPAHAQSSLDALAG